MSELDVYIASDAKIKYEYFKWLCDLVHISGPDSYLILGKELFKTSFYSLVNNDNNREADGKRLRKDFLDEENYLDSGALDGPCSVLEMLIALSIRIEKELYKLDEDNKCIEYFWMLISNLGLDQLDDEHYVEKNGDLIFNHVMDIFLNRKYNRKGLGGLFPLKNTKNDQRKIEIWYQMQEYLNENF